MSGGETSDDEIVAPKPQTKQQIDINNPYSPYYLSNSDHTGYIISPVTLTGQNYGTWSRLVINGLKSKNKLGFCERQNNQTRKGFTGRRCVGKMQFNGDRLVVQRN